MAVGRIESYLVGQNSGNIKVTLCVGIERTNGRHAEQCTQPCFRAVGVILGHVGRCNFVIVGKCLAPESDILVVCARGEDGSVGCNGGMCVAELVGIVNRREAFGPHGGLVPDLGLKCCGRKEDGCK